MLPRSAIDLSTLKPKPVEWLWKDRIPLGEITILDGDPATNKSSLAIDLAARVSVGCEMPDRKPATKAGVLLATVEDSVEKTVLPRCQAAGADCAQIAVINSNITIPDDLADLQQAALAKTAKLLIIDPITSFLSSSINNDQGTRRSLADLQAFAGDNNVAVVLIRHLNQSVNKSALYRGAGAIAITAIARSGLLAANHPADPHLRVLCQYKSSFGALAPTLVFEASDNGRGVVRIQWHGECDITPQQALAAPSSRISQIDRAKQLLLEILGDKEVAQQAIQQRALEQRIAWRTVERAKSLLGIKSVRNTFGGPWCWKLGENGDGK